MVEAHLPVIRPYEEWLSSESIPVAKEFHVGNVNSLDLVPWPRKGGLGVHINIEGSGCITAKLD